MKRFNILQSVLYTATTVGCLSTSSVENAEAVTFYTADGKNSSTSTVGLGQTHLGNGVLGNPSSLTIGSNIFKYTAVNFTPTESGTFKFGQTYSEVDSIMILYDGIFDTSNPGAGALIGNDDTGEQTHRDTLGSDAPALIKCYSTYYCPQITYSVEAGKTYTLLVSVYSVGYNSSFNLPFDFYATGDVIFGAHTGRTPINLAKTSYGGSELYHETLNPSGTVDPIFVGGTLTMDQSNAIYNHNFTVSSIASNAIDQNNHHSIFNGVFSDTTSTTNGQMTIVNSAGTEGSVTFNGNNTYSGLTTVADGATLIIGNNPDGGAALSGGGDVLIQTGAVLGGFGSVSGNIINDGVLAVSSATGAYLTGGDKSGNFHVGGSLNNNGLVRLGGNQLSGDKLNVAGDYFGNNGLITFDTVLGGDHSATDQLIIGGNATGTTKVNINNLGGIGAQVVDGIELIHVNGNSDDNAFEQNNRVVAGAYDYNLTKGNATGTNTQSWFLRSSGNLRPEAGGYIGLAEFSQDAFYHSFHDRQQLVGNEYRTSWTRVEYSKNKSKIGDKGQLTNKSNRSLLHVGSDVYQNGPLHLGVMAGYNKGEIKTSAQAVNATGERYTNSKSDGFSAGAYASWLNQSKENGGLYADLYIQHNRFRNSVQGNTLTAEKYNSHSTTVSAEAGYGFAVGTKVTVEPQVQLVYNNLGSKTHKEKNGSTIRTPGRNDFSGRIGVRVQGHGEKIQPFASASYWVHDGKASVQMDDQKIESDRARHVAEVKVGGEVKVSDHVSVFGQVQGSIGNHSSSSYGGNVGMKVNW